jgi:hypothetical protein
MPAEAIGTKSIVTFSAAEAIFRETKENGRGKPLGRGGLVAPAARRRQRAR